MKQLFKNRLAGTASSGSKTVSSFAKFLVAGGVLAGVMLVATGCKMGGSKPNSMPSLTPSPLKIPQVWHESFDEALTESAKTEKPILANFTGSDWCHWCVKLKSDVFETDAFGRWAEDKVVLVNLDYPRRASQPAELQQQNKALSERYAISGYPTVLLLDSQGNVLGKLGYQKDPQEWVQKADVILNTR